MNCIELIFHNAINIGKIVWRLSRGRKTVHISYILDTFSSREKRVIHLKTIWLEQFGTPITLLQQQKQNVIIILSSNADANILFKEQAFDQITIILRLPGNLWRPNSWILDIRMCFVLSDICIYKYVNICNVA